MDVCVSHPLLLHFESICQISGNSGPLGVSRKQEDLNHRVWVGEQDPLHNNPISGKKTFDQGQIQSLILVTQE